MRKLVLAAIVGMFSIASSVAQMSDEEVGLMRSILKSEVKVYFAQNIELTTSEAAPFWEIYDAYENELKPSSDARIKLMREIIKSEGVLSEDEMHTKIMEAIKLQKKRRDVRIKYYKLYKKKMGVKVAAQFYQLDQYINTMVTASLNEGMPIVIPEVKK
ncbi:hypothetical protein [Carboxylicivirga sp. N1Y90]|uniref:hypothetical protein n=1 Tax=Carboxylicivirga fragile TaxID=3417571 RepID=UPI003D328514|nr:hypothetical protein [Marinilabiliaceae bacterium N1Y90]